MAITALANYSVVLTLYVVLFLRRRGEGPFFPHKYFDFFFAGPKLYFCVHHTRTAAASKISADDNVYSVRPDPSLYPWEGEIREMHVRVYCIGCTRLRGQRWREREKVQNETRKFSTRYISAPRRSRRRAGGSDDCGGGGGGDVGGGASVGGGSQWRQGAY